jgi:adenylate kinase family enzyme
VPKAPFIGRRICVVGNAATGKTTLARALAGRLGLRYIDRDALVWGPGWTAMPRDELSEILDGETSRDGWTYDGHLRGSRPYEQLVLARCDTIVWLDFPRWRAMASVIWRTLGRVLRREELWGGNRETWRMALSRDWSIGWAWRNHARLRHEYAALFTSPLHASKARIRLRSRRAVNRWLSSLLMR